MLDRSIIQTPGVRNLPARHARRARGLVTAGSAVLASAGMLALCWIARGDPAAGTAAAPTSTPPVVHPASEHAPATATHYQTVKVGNLDIFYREAGPKDAPTLLLLHGFPTSSQMFRNLIPALADRYHLVAPDYPGYGHSSMPPRSEFAYTFDNVSGVMDAFTEKLGLTKYALYVQDYGRRSAIGSPPGIPIGSLQSLSRTAMRMTRGWTTRSGSRSRLTGMIRPTLSDANALRKLITYDATRWQYTVGVPNPDLVSPDGADHDQFLMDRPGNDEVQLDMLLSYGSNPPLYPQWQAYFREHQPPMLIAWGKNDPIFPAAGAEPYKRDLKNLEYHLLDAGHFALETDGDTIAHLIRDFLARQSATAARP